MKRFNQFLVGAATALALIVGGLLAAPTQHTQAASLPSTGATTTTPRSILSIDSGRKYFSPSQLKAIIDSAEKNGYTDVQLMLGNDALRFLLDDMTVKTADGQTFDSESVKNAIIEGNKTYYDDPSGNHLTQAEMDDLLAYAKTRHINIIPVINSPGHMDAILYAMERLRLKDSAFDNSKRTFNINSYTGRMFVEALLEKYVQYFSGHTDMFNFGADEFANDVDTGGWNKLQESGSYKMFVVYVNELAALAKKYGMRPVVFNDGIYYNHEEKFGTFDSSLIISYWTAGWSGYNVASANFLSQKGHDIINTNDAWYYVIGRDTPEQGGYSYQKALENISTVGFNQVVGTNNNTALRAATINVPTIGSTQAIWADDPSQTFDLNKVTTLMNKFGQVNASFLDPLADYAAFYAAVQKIPSNTNIYTASSLSAVQTARNSANLHLRRSSQSLVGGYASNLLNAIGKLQIRPANYNAVDAAIARAQQLNPNAYLNFAVVNAAIAKVSRGQLITSQAVVDAMAGNIDAAIAALIPTQPGKVLPPRTSPTVPQQTPGQPSPAPRVKQYPNIPGGNTQSDLPATGESNANGLITVGLALVSLAAGLGFSYRREHA